MRPESMAIAGHAVHEATCNDNGDDDETIGDGGDIGQNGPHIPIRFTLMARPRMLTARVMTTPKPLPHCALPHTREFENFAATEQ